MTVKFGADISYFLWSVGAGFIFAVFYDFVRTLRKVMKCPDIVINIIDIVILLVYGFITVQIAYYINNGEFRIYSAFCIGIAFLLYRLLMGDLLGFIFEKFIKSIFNGIGKTVKTLSLPVKVSLNFIKRMRRKMICIKERICSKIIIKKGQ